MLLFRTQNARHVVLLEFWQTKKSETNQSRAALPKTELVQVVFTRVQVCYANKSIIHSGNRALFIIYKLKTNC